MRIASPYDEPGDSRQLEEAGAAQLLQECSSRAGAALSDSVVSSSAPLSDSGVSSAPSCSHLSDPGRRNVWNTSH